MSVIGSIASGSESNVYISTWARWQLLISEFDARFMRQEEITHYLLHNVPVREGRSKVNREIAWQARANETFAMQETRHQRPAAGLCVLA